MDGLEREFAGEVAVVRLDAELPANLALQERLGVRGHPSAAVLDAGGQVTARFFGPQEAESVRAAMAAVAP